MYLFIFITSPVMEEEERVSSGLYFLLTWMFVSHGQSLTYLMLNADK